jgi:hypothetical protein
MSATSHSQPKMPQPAATQPAATMFPMPGTFWIQYREASLNWLAFGLLLAAWNAAGDDASGARRRPEALRGYSSVSVRAAQRSMSHDP